MSEPLTKRQHEILCFIKDFMKDYEYAPSFREIASHFQLRSIATVAEHVNTLKEKGYLNTQEHIARSLSLSDSLINETKGIPLLGTIAAGQPIEAIRTNEIIDIPQDMATKNTFALRVRGNSMIEDAILDGDYVIIEATPNIQDGDIVVALINDSEVTLKRFYREPNGIRLQPANHTMKPLFVTKASIQGKVKGVIRRFVF